MAKNSDKQAKNTVSRLKKFFLGIYTELKLVVWPSKKTFQQSVLTVLILCFISALLIFVVDTVMRVVLDFAGFNDPTSKAPAAQTDTVKKSKVPEKTVNVSEPTTTSTETTSTKVAPTATTK